MVSLEGVPLWVWMAATLGWCGAAVGLSYRVARWGGNVGKGKKLAAGPFLMLPFMLLNGLLPSANARAILSFTFCWVTPCKLLLLFFADFFIDCPSWSLSHFSHFLLALLLPVRIKGTRASLSTRLPPAHHLPTLPFELSALLSYLSYYPLLHPPFTHFAHCLTLYLVLDLPHRLASIALRLLYGIETQPAFFKPWFSTSITDFWGRRWNLTANALLRHTVYNPIINLLTSPPSCSPPPLSLRSAVEKDGVSAPPNMDLKHLCLLPTQGKPLPLSVRLIGVNATFFLSGLIHELLYFCLTQAVVPTWEVTAFFIVHGIVTSAEIIIRRVCPKHLIFRMPRPVKVVITMAFMYATSALLFFPQLVRAGIFLKCTAEYRAIKEAMSQGGLNSNMLITFIRDFYKES